MVFCVHPHMGPKLFIWRAYRGVESSTDVNFRVKSPKTGASVVAQSRAVRSWAQHSHHYGALGRVLTGWCKHWAYSLCTVGLFFLVLFLSYSSEVHQWWDFVYMYTYIQITTVQRLNSVHCICSMNHGLCQPILLAITDQLFWKNVWFQITQMGFWHTCYDVCAQDFLLQSSNYNGFPSVDEFKHTAVSSVLHAATGKPSSSSLLLLTFLSGIALLVLFG